MATEVVWTLRARQDLRNVVLYIARDNPMAAQSFRQRILDKVEQLHSFPESGRVVLERRAPNIREVIVPPYRIVYRFKAESVRVEVLRIWHGAHGEPGLVA
jgi:plasmid stabilization system protein ParE